MMRFAAALFLMATTAVAETRTPSHCIALADATPGMEFLQRAAYGAPLEAETIRLSYIRHSTYLLETHGGITAATDFTGTTGMGDHIPTIVTMDHAHSSHWTAFPDPAIPFVLRGWGTGGLPAEHRLDLDEMLVRNVPTDIRSRYDGGVEHDGNSIFIFEVAGLCIGHLGHLHHEPSDEQYASIGRLDVVMAAVDGGMTVDTTTMVRILKRFRSSVVLPMHWHNGYSLGEFTKAMAGDFDIVNIDSNSIEISLDNLPSRPQIIILQPQFLREYGYDE